MHYDGSTWTRPPTPFASLTEGLNAITGNSLGQVWIVGAAGTMLYYDGKIWARWIDPSGLDLHGVWFDANSGGVWAVGDNGLILHDGPPTK